MANVNITGQGTFAANNYTVPNPTVNVSTVSFHAADADCKVCFANSATFGMSSVVINKGPAQALTLKGIANTSFNVVKKDDKCSGTIKDTDYTITMGGGVPGGKKPSKK